MRIQTDAIGLGALLLIFGSWLVFALLFLLRKRTEKTEVVRRAPAARLGITLQAIAYALVWTFRRSRWWPFPASMAAEAAVAAVAVGVVWASDWLCLRAIQTLGKQWTVQARLVKGHELITTGPYAFVRNPIYLSMFGLLLGTGLAVSQPWALLAAMVVYLLGNYIRIHAEENLLRESFGAQFDEYTRRVPAFLPRIF